MDEGQAAELVAEMLQGAIDLGFEPIDDDRADLEMRDIVGLDIGEVTFTLAGQRFRLIVEQIGDEE